MTFTDSALDQAALVRAGEASARELVEASLATIEARDGELGAFVTLCAERALEEAERVRAGDPRPLAGVPIAVKDLGALTGGVRTTMGSAAMEDWVPPVDSAVVRRLRAAGAILVGKTSTPELGLLPVTEPLRFGPTRNPWDPSRTAGGSSGGSGAAVAAGMVALAHGNDGGGSLRIPASCCGLVGLKPGRGRVSPAPSRPDPLGLASDGVLTRTVADTALALDVLAGPEPGDPYWAPPPQRPFLDEVGRDPGRLSIRVWTVAPGPHRVDPACADAVRETAALLEELGHDVEAEDAADAVPAGFLRRFAEFWPLGIDVRVAALGRMRGRALDLERLEPLTQELVRAAARAPASEFLAGFGELREAGARLAARFGAFDVLLTPTLATPPVPVGSLAPAGGSRTQVLQDALDFVPFTPPWNVTGQPAVSLPLAIGDGGLPVGVQLVGPPAGEGLLLALAAQLEAARPWSDRRPARP